MHDQNLKLILGLIWTLILRFQIAGGEDEDPGGLKSALLEWVNRQIVPQVLIQEFNLMIGVMIDYFRAFEFMISNPVGLMVELSVGSSMLFNQVS